MTCPRCNTATLEELDREGISIDRCTSCRGVWLDRGELERLTARERDRGGDDFDEDSDPSRGKRGRGRRGGFWDLFD